MVKKNDLEFVHKDKDNNDQSNLELKLDNFTFKTENKIILAKVLYEKLSIQKEKQINNLQSEVNNLQSEVNNLQSEVNNLQSEVNNLSNKKTFIKKSFFKYMIKFSSIFILKQKKRKKYRNYLKNKFQIDIK